MQRILMALLVCVMFAGAAQGEMVHRYDFLSNVQDLVGGAHGALIDPQGIAVFDGAGKLDLGNSGIEGSNQSPFTSGAFIDLPNGMISALGPVATFEIWTTYRGNHVWEQLFSFGTSAAGEDIATGQGNYLMCSPQDGAGELLRFEDFPGGHVIQGSSKLQTNVEEALILTFDSDGVMTAYRNGALIGSTATGINLPDLNDVNNWLGRSQWPDLLYEGGYNEFRIYNEIRSEYELMADFLAGPDASPAEPVYPAMDATAVALSPNLEWAPGLAQSGTPTAYDIYLAKDADMDPNQLWHATVPTDTVTGATSWTPPAELETFTVYNWRVDTHVNGDVVKGPIWSFRTLRFVPELVGPVGTIAAAGESVEFTVGISSLSSVVECAWYKVDAGGDILLTPDTKYEVTCGDTASVLTINDVELADEGEYYAIVTNADGPAISVSAPLAVERLIGHWPFDGTAADLVGGNDGSVVRGEIAFAPGIVGDQAVDFRTLDYAVTVPSAAYVVDDAGWTFTWWEWADPNMTGVSWAFESMLASGPNIGNEAFQFNRYNGTGYDLFLGGRAIQQAAGAAPRGQWYFHSVAYDRAAGEARWYRDGREQRVWNPVNPVLADVIYVGDEHQTGTERMEFKGFIDDLKFYNYPLGRYEVAAAYHEVRGEDAFCVEYPTYDISGPEGEPDCTVNLYDFAAIGTEWLECNIYPQTFCP